jgi:hypothetical protein
MSTRAAALRDLDDHRAIDASIAASGMTCAPVVRSARPAAKTIETNFVHEGHLWISKAAPSPEAVA